MLGLQEVVKLPVFDGFDRQCVVFTDGHVNPGLGELEGLSEISKKKLVGGFLVFGLGFKLFPLKMRIFVVGYGLWSYRPALRFSSAGRGTFVIAKEGEEKAFLHSLDQL